jgi:formamidopyrimidine-DNA glycosylase
MPELPEVETIRSGLEKYLVGHKIEDVQINVAKSFIGNPKEIIGAKIAGTRRFGKVLVIDLSNGFSLLTHLKLTGQYIYRGPHLKNPPSLSQKVFGLPGKHTRVIFKLDQNAYLYFNDLRKFGWIRVLETDKVTETGMIGKMGPEPLVGQASSGQAILTLEFFRKILSKSKKPIKLLLMEQEKISGIGNIYANEALWLAGINPRKKSLSLSPSLSEKLFKAIEKVLKEGIKAGGASDMHYVTAAGDEGKYQEHFLVYDKKGEICSRPACRQAGVKIEKIQLGGRGTYFCPICQKL